MARKAPAFIERSSRTNRKRKGVHAKKGSSKLKQSKLYKKKYNKQGK